MRTSPRRLLVVDLLWRGRWRAAFFLPLLLLMLWAASEGTDGSLMARAFWMSAGLVFMMGPQLTMRFVARPIWYFPVSHRDVWRAGWLVSTVALVALTTAVKLLAMLVLPRAPGISGLTLSGAYDFAATGVGCVLLIVSAHSPWARAPWRYLSSFARQVADVLIPLGFFVVVYGGWLTGSGMPMRWSELTATSGAILATLIALTIATYFHRPVPRIRANPQTRPARAREAHVAFHRGGLSGLPRLLAREYGFAMLIGVAIAAASTVVVLVMTGLLRSSEGLRTLLRAELLLIDGSDGSDGSAMAEGYRMLALMIWYGFFCASIAARFPSMTRHLRVLPLSTARLNALLVGWPAIIWLTVWTAVVLLRYLVIGTPPTSLLLALLIGTVGLSALMQSLALRLTPQSRFVFSLIVGVLPLAEVFSPPSPAVVAAVGLCAFAAAAVITRAALRRNSTYKNGLSILGIPIPQGRP